MIYIDAPFDTISFERATHAFETPSGEIAAHWSQLRARCPDLFDGEIFACSAMRFECGRTVFSLCRTRYSHYAWARAHDRPLVGAWAFGTNVLVWDESRDAFAFFERSDAVLFERGRIGGIGGVVEWDGEVADLRAHVEASIAAELREEIDADVEPRALVPIGLWVDERTLKLEILYIARVRECRIANAENVRIVYVPSGGLVALLVARADALELSMREHLFRVAARLDAARGAPPSPHANIVACADLSAVHASVATEVEGAALRVLRSGRYVHGPEVDAFEKEIAAYCSVQHAVGCASGTDALVLALMASGIGPGDEVLVPAFTIFVDPEVVSRVGAEPRFVDVDPKSLAIEPERCEAAIGPRTRAIIATHLYGMTADMPALRELAARHRLVLVEDACQALGSRHRGVPAGALGDVGCISFFPTKNLGAYGDGGVLTTNDAALAALARKLRNHGAAEKYMHERIGLNSRLDAVQAAMLRAKLPHLGAWNARRAEIAARYDAALRVLGIEPPFVPKGCTPNWHQYTIRAQDRDALRERLAACGIETAVHYPRAAFEHPPYASILHDFPVATAAAREVLSLPIHPYLRDEDVDRVSHSLARVR